MESAETFLSQDELAYLTGRKLKSKQVDVLRRMGIPFFVNARGAPVVTRAAVEGRHNPQKLAETKWRPGLVRLV